MTRGSETVQRRALLERRIEILPYQTRAGRGRAGTHPIALDQDDVDARRGEGRRTGASSQSAANDDDARPSVAAVPWILGSPGAWEAIEEIGNEPHAPQNSNLNGIPGV